MTPEELRNAFQQPGEIANNAFRIAKSISSLCHDPQTIDTGREMVIRALEHRQHFSSLNGVIDSLAEQVGLFPYTDPQNLSVHQKIAFEYHRPISFEGYDPDVVFHTEQAEVYRGLMEGQSYVLSAPTSFGKSLIIDALLASGNLQNIVIIVPTISLIDETRRRLTRFRHEYKLITHPTQMPAERNVFVLTQERAIERNDFGDVDLLVIDEFYKLSISSDEDSDRASILNHALYKLHRISKQTYLLGPNIETIPEGFGDKFNCLFKRTNFNTVVSDVVDVSGAGTRQERFLRLSEQLSEPTLVYCRSPRQANEVLSLLEGGRDTADDETLDAAANWLGDAFHPQWTLRNALRKRVGIHHGRIPRSLAHLNVKLFNENKLDFLVCTSSLIEGVNTVAKNVIIYEGKLGQPRLDFFTFQNIRGRSGRMFQHFVGRVFVLDPPPQQRLDFVDIPVFTQTDEAPLGLLVQVEREDLADNSRRRMQYLENQEILPMRIVRENAHIDPNHQIELANRLMRDGRQLNAILAWSGYPTWHQLRVTCDLIFDFFVRRGQSGVLSGGQLAFRVSALSREPTVQDFIQSILDKDKQVENADQAVETAFMFQRNWATFKLPRYLRAIDIIQNEIYGRQGLPTGDYSAFAAQVESLFLPTELPALEEYGIPIQISTKVRHLLALGDGLDAALDSLSTVSETRLRASLTEFEVEMVRGALV